MLSRAEQNRTHLRHPELDSGSHSRSLIKSFFGLFRRFSPRHDSNGFSEKAIIAACVAPRNDVKAFTLAEVLITLGIIGVVASMTIPTLMKNVQDKQFKEAVKKAYSNISQVIIEMKQDEGGTLDYYVNNSTTFKIPFAKHFKIIQDCGWATCVPSVAASDIYKSLNGAPANTLDGGEGQFVTQDGMFLNIQNGGSELIIIVDVNGYARQPNIYGVDTFAFQVINDVLVPTGPAGTNFLASSRCVRNWDNARQGLGCTDYAIRGIDY